MHGGCVKGMPVRRDIPGSGCRRDCLHRALVSEYRDAKILDEEVRKIRRENETGGFLTESAQWDRDNPSWTFRDFLISRRRVSVDSPPVQA